MKVNYHLLTITSIQRVFPRTLMLLFWVSSFGQNLAGNVQKAYENHAYIDSRAIYLKVVANGHKSAQLYQHLGDTYYFNADLKNAQKWYALLFKEYRKEKICQQYFFRYAQSLKNIGQFQLADSIMRNYNTISASIKEKEQSKNYTDSLENFNFYSASFKLVLTDINSKQFDFAPSFYKKGLVFSSNRKRRSAAKNINLWDNEPFFKLYKVDMQKKKKKAKRFAKVLNTQYNQSTAAFSKDGKTVFFTRNNYNISHKSKGVDDFKLLKIYTSEMKDGEWGEPIELPFNSDVYSVAHPALSPDEKTLYFASDMPGGYGLSDLYKVDILANGMYGEPINLGNKINTPERETFPFVANNGDLYFSSDGHPGLGGLDLFILPFHQGYGKFYDCFNLGPTINTSYDDHTLIWDEANTSGYLASNREGGIGGDDIYTIKRIKAPDEECYTTLSGVVQNQEDGHPLGQTDIILMNMDGEIMATTKSKENGSFTFGKILCNYRYVLNFSVKNYIPKELVLSIEVKTKPETIKGIPLTPKKMMANGEDLNKLLDLIPIYFDLNRSDIRKDAVIELQKVIAAMQKYPRLKIEVRSHADSRGTQEYNRELSQKRSSATVQYLIENGGITPERLSAKGLGEAQLLNLCSDGVKCEEPMHQSNRRTEFIITDM